MAWAKDFESAERVVAKTNVGALHVSTVFIGLNHQYGEGPPLVFETMVFDRDGHEAGPQRRYSTWEEAEAGHQEVVWWAQVHEKGKRNGEDSAEGGEEAELLAPE